MNTWQRYRNEKPPTCTHELFIEHGGFPWVDLVAWLALHAWKIDFSITNNSPVWDHSTLVLFAKYRASKKPRWHVNLAKLTNLISSWGWLSDKGLTTLEGKHQWNSMIIFLRQAQYSPIMQLPLGSPLLPRCTATWFSCCWHVPALDYNYKLYKAQSAKKTEICCGQPWVPPFFWASYKDLTVTALEWCLRFFHWPRFASHGG
jgi:hypothetical protein